MCEASNLRKIHSYLCITCYFLCVFFDVHLHGVKCAGKGSISSRYDAVVKIKIPNGYYRVRTVRSVNSTFVCKNKISTNDSQFFKGHLDKIIEMVSPNASLKKSDSTGSGLQLFDEFLKSIGLGVPHSHEEEHEHEHEHDEDEERHEESKETDLNVKLLSDSKCVSAKEMYSKLKLPKHCGLQSKQFQEICPSLIYQIRQKSCEIKDQRSSFPEFSVATVWGCSTAAVIVISLVGLLAVALIPCMKKTFYDVLVQFLIAVGVGTLAGDAVVHLIPHALLSHDHGHGGHTSNKEMQMAVFKSSMALVGAHVFFLTERLTTMFQSFRVRRRIRRKQKDPNRMNAEVDPDLEQIGNGRSASRNGHGHVSEVALVNTPGSAAPTETTSIGGSGFDFTPKGSHDGHSHCHGHSRMAPSDCNVVAEEADRLMHQTTVHHCHSHDFSSIKAIAWTVIMGDGLHNFCDGVAIGAAFANDIRGGLSTSIAVIWHELPHEIGDFAVLLQAGMSVKMALFYNVLSSIFCLAGMVIGITVGGMHSVTPWVFMLSAGMFLYIAFVDMLPNLTCDQVDENGKPTNDSTKAHRKLVFFVQNAGIFLGYAVMFVIALYEDKILS